MYSDPILEQLAALYEEIDRAAVHLAHLHADRLHCGPGCSSCCIDNITVFVVEASNIRKHNADLLSKGIPHPAGACAFLDDRGNCRIYKHRPYVCRTQGLPIRWIEEREDGETVEMRDICAVNEKGSPVEVLPAETCWTIGPFEERLSSLQGLLGNGARTRIALRDLFRKTKKA